MGKPEKIMFGIKNVHVAKLLNETEMTFDTPKPLKGAVSLSVDIKQNTKTFYADDEEYVTITTVDEISGDLEVYYITDEMQMYLFDLFKSQNGLMVETDKIVNSKFALLGEYETDVKKRRFCYYLVTFTRPNFEIKTKEGGINPNTQKISLKVERFSTDVSEEGKVFKTRVAQADGEVWTNWFKKVTLPTGKAE